MNANEINTKLQSLSACAPALEWSKGKSLAEIWETCERGDWMLWLASRAKVNKRTLTAAKADCAATVKHLMKDPRSLKAVEIAQAYGRGEATDIELAYAAYAADAAYAAAAYAAADAAAAAYAADAAAYAYAAYAAAAYAADAAAYAAADAAAAADARSKSQRQTADIVRSHIFVHDLNL